MKAADQKDGLFFSASDLALALANRDHELVKPAVALLRQPREDALSQAYLSALRYRFEDDIESGRAALSTVGARDGIASAPDANPDAIKRTLGWLATLALLREHPVWQKEGEALLSAAAAPIAQLNQIDAPPDPLLELWLGALNLAAGILLDDAALRERGANVYREAVTERIHPEGYLKGIVDRENAENSYESQLSATAALVVLPEMARQADIDLWSYHSRAVTPITAATYTFYYYFFPEKWRWAGGLTRAANAGRHAARRRLHGNRQPAAPPHRHRASIRRTASHVLSLRRRLDHADACAGAAEGAPLASLVILPRNVQNPPALPP